MRKNVAGQRIGAQMITASDGSAFTGNVTCYVTVDGVQAIGEGSSPSGSCEHVGNGYHEYTPTQDETNGDHLAFTFTGSGAVPQTVQADTKFGADIEEVNGDSEAAVKMAKAVGAIAYGTVGAGSTATRINVKSLNFTGADADQLNGRTLTFLGSAGSGRQYQATDITAYEAGSPESLTVTSLTRAPSEDDPFVIT